MAGPLLLLLIILLTPLMGACQNQGDWNMFSLNATHNSCLLEDIEPENLLWSFDLGDWVIASPAAENNKIYVASLEGML